MKDQHAAAQLRQKRITLIELAAEKAKTRARPDWPKINKTVNAIFGQRRKGGSPATKEKHNRTVNSMPAEIVAQARRYISLTTAIPAKRRQILIYRQNTAEQAGAAGKEETE